MPPMKKTSLTASAFLLSLGFAGTVLAQATIPDATPHSTPPHAGTVSLAQSGSNATGKAEVTGPRTPTTPGAETRELDRSDRKFVEKAALDSMAEVRLAQAAQSKAGNDQVKAYAKRMQEDHAKASEELEALASSKGIRLPRELDRDHKGDVEKLAKMEGDKFDREYMERMVSEHRKDVKAFEKQAKGGKDPDLKAYARKNLPTLQEHLKMAQATQAAVEGRGAAKARKQ